MSEPTVDEALENFVPLNQQQRAARAVIVAGLKRLAAEVERLEWEKSELARDAAAGKMLLTAIEGMVQPEVQDGDPVEGYIRVYERQKAEIERLRAEIDRRTGMRRDCQACGKQTPFSGAVFCSEACALAGEEENDGNI